jgi:hypothetical protein
VTDTKALKNNPYLTFTEIKLLRRFEVLTAVSNVVLGPCRWSPAFGETYSLIYSVKRNGRIASNDRINNELQRLWNKEIAA